MSQIPDVQLGGLYGDLILEHYRNPHNRHPVAGPDLEAQEFNPFCGDRVGLKLKLDQQSRVSEINADSEGCSIIQASTSMLSDLLKGKTLEEIAGLAAAFRSMMAGKDIPPESMTELGELDALQVVRRYPVRIKCALLPWTALEEAMQEYWSRVG
ncbi:MAG: SUF system NifU family Fe-S cluster assembly protein [SAR202 cluster bacterium Io17-Chloro-G2]|nr:MAG: SUF system NifU family Fe-S cluster assembly protein [SAR202 cluster bacterium Io17-Chloro-G2]